MDLVFDLGVDGGGGVVEEEEPGVGEDRPGQRDALALAAGEGEAVLADLGVVALGQLGDEPVGLGGAGGGLDLLLGGVREAVGDVGADGVGEEEGVLGDESDGGAQGVEGEFADVVAADEDGAVADVVEAGQEQRDGGLPGAGGTDDGDGLPGRISSENPSRTGRPSSYAKDTSSNSTVAGASAGSSLVPSLMTGSVSTRSRTRSTPARACWPTVRTMASIRTGPTSEARYAEKATKVPRVISPR